MKEDRVVIIRRYYRQKYYNQYDGDGYDIKVQTIKLPLKSKVSMEDAKALKDYLAKIIEGRIEIVAKVDI